MATSINELFVQSAREAASRPAYMYRGEGGTGEWTSITYETALQRTAAFGAGLLALGVGSGDRVAVLSNTRIEWTITDFGVLGCGAALVPIYQTNSAAECEYVLRDSGASAVIVEDASQLAKVDEVRDGLRGLRTVVVMDPRGCESRIGSDGIVAFSDVEADGATRRDSWFESSTGVSTEAMATLIYTSGTTGAPKGCVLSHANMWQSAENVATTGDQLISSRDRVVLFLPLSHILARVIQLACARLHAEVAYSTVPTLMDDLQHIKPTLLPSVPRVFEKAHTRISGMFAEATGAKAKLIDWALGVGRKRNTYKWVMGKSVPPLLAPQYALADKLVFSKIHARFGGNLRAAVSGGAPLSREVQEFFLAVGIPIFEGYGLTEATPLTLNLPGEFRLGSIGKPLGDTEIRIVEDGEILARSGMVFQGYYNNDEATAETRDADGWLHTGDIGMQDSKGFVYITDRKKDIIITAGGKNVAPQNIENELKSTQYVSQALVYGDRKPYITALVTLDPDEMASFAEKHELPTDMRKLVQTPEVEQVVRDAVAKVNSHVGRVEQVKRVRILPIDFSQETGELTPSLKLKRKVVVERFGRWIEEMYEPDAPEVAPLLDDEISGMQRSPVNA